LEVTTQTPRQEPTKWILPITLFFGVGMVASLFFLWHIATTSEELTISIKNSEPFPIRVAYDDDLGPWTIAPGEKQVIGVLPIDGQVSFKAYQPGRPPKLCFQGRFLVGELGPPGNSVTATIDIPTGKLEPIARR
jgi:hypothetical protein